MPKRRRGPVDDSGEDSDASFTSERENKSHTEQKTEDPPMEWPVVLKTAPQNKRTKNEEDDEYTETDVSSDEEEEVASSDAEFEYSDGGFVVDSDDNVNSKGYRNQNNKRGRRRRAGRTESAAELRRKRAEARQSRTQRGRGRPRGSNNKSDSSQYEDSDEFDVSEGSIAEELRELKGEESPARKERHFRIRQPVDYMIPPPPTVEEVAQAKAKEAEETAAAKNKTIRPRRLFEVSGPFGGHDVHTLFNVTPSEVKAIVDKKMPKLGGSGYAARSSNLSFLGAAAGGGGGAASGPGYGAGGANVSASAASNDTDVDPIEVSGVDFSMVGGLDSYIAKLKEMVSLPLLYPELYEKFGITPPRGVLFHGPPGTGKTLMARALAASHKQEKVTFYMRKGADILSKWIGESERQLRALFDEARAHQPSIIFFDEIDGLAPVRSAKQEQHHASIVSTLLALMDGMDNRGQVVVIGATNRPDSVDPALRRPGRFDREFYFPLPDFEARQKILEIHTRKWQPPPSKELVESIAHKTKGFGGADLRALTTEAALLAINRAFPQIYGSSQKLNVDASSIQVRPQDFTLALERTQPSTARAAGVSLAQPIPPRVEPLLRDTFAKVASRVRIIFPNLSKEAKLSALFLNETQFDLTQSVSNFQQHRIHRPRLLLAGPPGNGQMYIAKAISNLLEGVYVRELSTSALFASGALQPESVLVNTISELRQRSPACLLLSSLSEWASVPHLISLLAGLLRTFSPEERVFVVASDEIEGSSEEQQYLLAPLLEFFNDERIEMKINTSQEVLGEFFAPVLQFVHQNPVKCLEAHELPKPILPVLQPMKASPPANNEKESKLVEKENAEKEDSCMFSENERRELRVRSQLKIKLGMILDGFRQKYRRFRKPIIDESKLAYLFDEPIERFMVRKTPSNPVASVHTEPTPTPHSTGSTNADPDAVQINVADVDNEDDYDDDYPYAISEDHRIIEKSTGKKYFNMDLETVEDRLWNGFYCVPEQFLNDIEMIYRDAAENGERERLHKASEMLANAQVAIDDISMDRQFVSGCETVYSKDAQNRLAHFQNDESHQQKSATEHGDKTADSTDVKNEPSVQEEGAMEVIAQEAIEELEDHAVISQHDYDAEIDQPVQLDESVFKYFESVLLDASTSLTLEELEALFASLSDIAWQHRGEWNRTIMVNALAAHVKSIKQTV